MPLRLDNGWTGGQYSVCRAALGLYLIAHLAQLLPWGQELFSSAGALPDADLSPLFQLLPSPLWISDAPAVIAGMLWIGLAAAVALLLGLADRVAAIAIWYVLACLHARMPLIANPSLPFVGFMLLFHASLSGTPYSALAARGRADSGGGFGVPPELFAVLWTVMALGYSYSGYTKLVSPSWIDGSALGHILHNPLARPTELQRALLALPAGALRIASWGALGLELAFAPLALWARLRPVLWLAMVGMHLCLLLLIDFADLTLGMLLVHAFSFDPRWLPGSAATTPERIFYDGHSPLGHALVCFVIAEDSAARFRFAPLQDERFAAPDRSGAAPRAHAVFVQTAAGTMLTQGAALLHVCHGLGGLWRVAAVASRMMPSRARDACYTLAARTGAGLAKPPQALLPAVPPQLRSRFEP